MADVMILERNMLIQCIMARYPGSEFSLLSDPETHEVTGISHWVSPDGAAQPTSDELEALYLSSALPLVKARAKQTIDSQAEARRVLFLTPGSGQAMTYLLKETEAKACLEAVNPQDGDYPLLAAEVGVTAETLAGVATAVLAASQAWKQAGAAIEKTRLAAKRAVDEAQSEEAVQAVLDGLAWPESA